MSYDSYDDVDPMELDLESEFDESTTNSGQDNVYKIEDALETPRWVVRTIGELCTKIEEGRIILDPPYQRKFVWTPMKQRALIDSVLRNYYIPSVIFVIRIRKDKTKDWVCIDGKQRLTSFVQFKRGSVYHKDKRTGKTYCYAKRSDTKHVSLPPPLVQSFDEGHITCIEYENLTDEQEREIFQRVQNGTPLTKPEQLQALPGPWPIFIQKMQIRFLDEGFGMIVPRNVSRSQDFQTLATMFYLIHRHHERKLYKAPRAPALSEWLQCHEPVPETLRTDLLQTLRIFDRLVRDNIHNKPFQKMSLHAFSMTGVLIFVHRHRYTLKELSTAVPLLITAGVKQMGFHQLEVMFNFVTKRLQHELKSKGGELATAAVTRDKRSHKNRSRRRHEVNDDESEVPASKPSVRKRKKAAATDDEAIEGRERETSFGLTSAPHAKRRRRDSDTSAVVATRGTLTSIRSKRIGGAKTTETKHASTKTSSKAIGSRSQKRWQTPEDDVDDEEHYVTPPRSLSRKKRRRAVASDEDDTPVPVTPKSILGKEKQSETSCKQQKYSSACRRVFCKEDKCEGSHCRSWDVIECWR
ncbi:hypothetical protein OBBRIDRAFT_355589 [Obba rivulosa]|uniref:GmrSD restriction endonucleases N-terminal domain-containing protein n=1 Tax=Obba rivulosa TaxID=1052685 RepID=A0A8E2AN07_9APHY|nr:hypothetical protein OBBRIDRAFT_355589 [Obba rivulosa]